MGNIAGLEIVIQEFNPICLAEAGSGKVILVKDLADTRKILYLYSYPETSGYCEDYSQLARIYNLFEENILGKMEAAITPNGEKSLLVVLQGESGESIDYGGIPGKKSGKKNVSRLK